VVVHDNIHVIQTANTTETAAMLHRLALHAQGLTGEGIRLRGPKPDLALAEVYARYLIEGLPEIGPQRVDAILRAFGSVRAALLADPSDSSRVNSVPLATTSSGRSIAGGRAVCWWAFQSSR